MFEHLSLQATSRLVLTALTASALVATGCSSDTQSTGTTGAGGSSTTTTSSTSTGTGGSETTSTSSTSTGTSGTGGGPSGSGVAIVNSKITQATDADKKAWLDAGEALDPTTLIVVISTEPETCTAPVFNFGTTNHRLVLIGLPQAMQQVGKYDLSTTQVIAYGTSWLGDGMGNGGGGKMVLNKGTVEVLSLDASTITVRLEGLTGDFSGQNGDHAATRCL